jgi:hypothetical protein
MTILKFVKEEASSDVIDIIEDALQKAKDGEIASVLIACLLTDGTTCHSFSNTNSSAAMMGAIEAAKYRFLNRWLNG